MKRKAFFLWLLLLVSMLLMVDVRRKNHLISQSQVNQNKEVGNKYPHILTVEDIKENLPIPIEEGEFEKVYGWIDKQTIVYSTNIQNHSNVYAYNLERGNKID